MSLLISIAGLDCTNLISTYPEDDPEEMHKNLKRKIMLAVGGINVFCGTLLAVGVSYYGATVLEEFYRFRSSQYAVLYDYTAYSN